MRRRLAGNFTLTELLVVITIIAVLAALLLPSLRNALESSYAVQCSSNQRQVCLLIQSYMDSNSGYQPGNYIYVPTSVSANGQLYWYQGLYPYQGSTSNSIFHCPVMTSRYNYSRGSIDYALMNYYTYSYYAANMAAVRPLALSQHPSRTVQFFDCAIFKTYDWSGKTYFQVQASARIWYGTNQSLGDWRHGGRVMGPGYYGVPKYYDGVCNAAFLDGHVTSLTDTLPSATKTAMQTLRN